MKIKVVKNDNYFMSDDFKNWLENHKNDIFKVKDQSIGNDGLIVYSLFKVSFKISKHFTEIVE